MILSFNNKEVIDDYLSSSCIEMKGGNSYWKEIK